MKFDIKNIMEDGLVQYTTEDERWYSFLDDAFPEAPTILRMGGRLFVPSVSWLAGYWPKGKGFEMFLKNKGQEADDVRDLAAERGSKIHQAIDKLLSDGRLTHDEKFLNTFNDRLEELSANEYAAVLTFVEFCREMQPALLSNERTVLNIEVGYAGTIDIHCTIDGEPWLIDVKTGKSVYMSHRLQLSAYKHAGIVWDGKIETFDPATKLGVLQVGYITKKGWKLTEIDDEFENFMHAYAIWKRENDGEKPNQVTFPQQINMEEVWHSKKAEDSTTPSASPAENSSANSAVKSEKNTPTQGSFDLSGDSPTTTRGKKAKKSKSSSRTAKKTSSSSSRSKRGTRSTSSNSSSTST